MKQKKQTINPIASGTKYKLYATALLCGLCIMVLQLVGSRMIAPFLGASIVVWTALIGVIMTSLAAGYYAGGRIADKRPSVQVLAAFIAGAALWVVILIFVEKSILRLLENSITNIYVSAIVAALLFFAVPSFLLATVTPFVIKLFSADNEKIGSIAGKVSACSTVGSIAGTFLGGFVLISFFPVKVILLITAFTLCIAAILMFSANLKTIAALCIAALAAFTVLYYGQKALPNMAIDETMYNSIFIAEYEENGRTIRALFTDSEKLQGRMYVDNPNEMIAEYLRFIGDAYVHEHIGPILMLGGGIYIFPRWLAAVYPNVAIDIVEIDPGITKAARDFFYLKNRPGQRIFHQDARYFVNRRALENAGYYDLIFQDAYGSPLNLPFQLSTVEYFSKVNTLLSENGVFLINFIGNLESAMFSGLHAAVKEAFPVVRIFRVNDTATLQNIIIAAYKNAGQDGKIPINEYNGTLTHKIAAFTDAFAPVERYTIEMIR